MGLIIKPDFCRRTIRAFVYLLHFRYGHSYAYRASRNAFIAENLRYGMYPWVSKKYMCTNTCEREPGSFTRERCTIVLGWTAQLVSVSA